MRYLSVLPDDMRAKFDDAKLRILQFSVVNEPSMNEIQKDKIKKRDIQPLQFGHNTR